MNNIKNTFCEKLHECNQHKKRIIKAKKILKENIPLSLEAYKSLNDIQLSFISA